MRNVYRDTRHHTDESVLYRGLHLIARFLCHGRPKKTIPSENRV